MVSNVDMKSLRHLPILPLAFFAACQSTVPPQTAQLELTLAPIDAAGEHETIWSYLSERYDANGDGQITREEHGRDNFDSVDRNGDGVIAEADFEKGAGRDRGGAREAGERPKRPEPPEEGVVAPDFSLQPAMGGETVTLSSYAGKKPVALIFGSYT